MSEIIEVKVPFANVNDESARLVVWEVARGQRVQEGQGLCKLETTKAVYDVLAPCAGVVDFSVVEGAEVLVGTTLCSIIRDAAEGSSAPIAGTPAAAPAATPAPNPAPASPAARSALAGIAPVFSRKAEALISRLGMSKEVFTGLSLVGEAEVRAKAERLGIRDDQAVPSPAAAADDAKRFESITPLERSKAWENKELLAADRAALKSTLQLWCRAPNLAQAGARRAPPVSRLALVLHALAQSLAAHKQLNATLRENGIAIYRDINLGFAVDMGRGLKVLTLANAERLSCEQINDNIEDLLVKYATDSLQVSEVTGSTFTLTDLSAEGIFAFDPLLNGSQCAILGLGAEGELAGQEGFMLSCAFDHRMLGGHQVAEFLRDLADRLGQHAVRPETVPVPAAESALAPCCSLCLQNAAELRQLEAYLLPSVEPKGYICSICLLGH